MEEARFLFFEQLMFWLFGLLAGAFLLTAALEKIVGNVESAWMGWFFGLAVTWTLSLYSNSVQENGVAAQQASVYTEER